MLRKHNEEKSGIKYKGNSNNYAERKGLEELKLNMISPLRENSDFLDEELLRNTKTVDTGVGTDPDILSLLSEMKNDKFGFPQDLKISLK